MSESESEAAEAAIAERLRTANPVALAKVARRFATRALAEGLFVRRSRRELDGSVGEHDVPIPPILSPVVISQARLAEMSTGARTLADALVTLTGYVLAGGAGSLAARLFGAFGPLERACLEGSWRATRRLATLRIDCFFDERGRPRVLELNATIPAMQSYSDIVSGEAVRALGDLFAASDRPPVSAPDRRANIEQLAGRVAHNAEDLREALVDLAGGPACASAIAIVSRRGDAQAGELGRHVRVWERAGHRVRHVFPDELRLTPDGGFEARGKRFDLVYRHVFARHLDLACDLARALVEPVGHRVFNPVCSQLEAKGMLAFLAEMASDEARAIAAGLEPDAIDTVRRLVPWSRPLVAGPAVLPDGQQEPDLVRWVRSHRAEVVLKKSWDYGGHGVFLGRDAGPGDEGEARIGQLLDGADAPPASWDALIDHALTDRDLWIVQALVESPRRRLLVANAEGAPVWRELHVDVSAYASLGTTRVSSGGACRAAPGRIVNIQGGGGVAPLLTEDVAIELARSDREGGAVS